MKKFITLLIILLYSITLFADTPGFYTININNNKIEFISFDGKSRAFANLDIHVTSLYGNLVNYKNNLLMDFHDKIYSICINTGETELIHDFSDQFDNKGASYLASNNDDLYVHHEFTSSQAGFLLKYNLEDKILTKITANKCTDPSILALSFDDSGNLFGYSEAMDKLLAYSLLSGNVEKYIGIGHGIGNATSMAYFNGEMWLFNSKSNGTDFYTVDLKTGKTKLQFSKPSNYFGMAFLENECTPKIFKCEFGDYSSDLEQKENYILTGDATFQNDNEVQLTDDQFYRSGGVWINEKLDLNDGFETTFSFKFSNGNNYNFYDGSLPGADGIAFIIQSNKEIMSGGFGGNLGYSNIKNCIAMEIDTYKNFQNDEPNGNHFSILANRNDYIDPNYNSTSHIITNEKIPIIYQDSIYTCKIRYNKIDLIIYLNKKGDDENYIIQITDFDIADYIDNNGYFNVGLTSSTGNSVETHDILSWDFCSLKSEYLVSADEEIINKKVYPNPSSNFIFLENQLNSKYQIFDLFGKKVQSGSIESNRIDIKRLINGIYYLKIENDNSEIIKIIKN